MHGTADKVVSIDFARSTVGELQTAGATIELHEYPGIGHTITRPMHDQLVASVRACLR